MISAYAKDKRGEPRLITHHYMCSKFTSVSRLAAMSMARLDPSNHPSYVRRLLETTIGTADTSTETSCAQHQSIDWFDQTAPDEGLSELQQLMTEADEERRKELKARVVQYINEGTVNLMVKEAQTYAPAKKRQGYVTCGPPSRTVPPASSTFG